MTKYIQANNIIVLDDADTDLGLEESGNILMIPDVTDDRNITLPDAALGLHYIFISQADLAHNVIIDAQVNGLFNGLLLNTDIGGGPAGVDLAVLVTKNNDDDVSFNNGTTKIGDYLDIYCDGDNWQVSGMSTDIGFS